MERWSGEGGQGKGLVVGGFGAEGRAKDWSGAE